MKDLIKFMIFLVVGFVVVPLAMLAFYIYFVEPLIFRGNEFVIYDNHSFLLVLGVLFLVWLPFIHGFFVRVFKKTPKAF